MTDSTQKCPNCDAVIPEGSPQRLCPTCLLKQAFLTQAPKDQTSASMPPPSPEAIADKFPQFEILECLGQGGMGVVYKARQKSLDRWVAIKILSPEKVDDPMFAERFAREAQTLAKLNHTNIVTIYDYGDADGLYYIVMEYIEGINLRDLLNDGEIQSEQALRVVASICEALQFAHDKGIVHRDIKPENILIDANARIKVADFGIASLVGSTGELGGTPPYMAPEQGAQASVDHRADIYALGAVLYEMLTGERPETPLDIPSQKVELDIRIDDIVLRALSKEPERRYRTAYDFKTVVQTVAKAKKPVEAPDPKPSRADIGPESKKEFDPRIIKMLGLLLVILGSLNLLSILSSLVLVPLFSTVGFNAVGLFSMSPLGGFNTFGMAGSAIIVVIILGVLSLLSSVLCILGGLHMYRGTSRNWSIVGAVSCCLIPSWWPLGLILGVGSLIYILISQPTESAYMNKKKPAPSKDEPQFCWMALIAFSLQFVAVVLILSFLILFGFYYGSTVHEVSPPL